MAGISNRIKGTLGDKGSRRLVYVGVGATALALLYLAMAPGNPPVNPSTVSVPPTSAPTIQGGNQVTPAYDTALAEADRRRIEEARQQGGSAIPTIRATNQDNTIPQLSLDPVEEAPPQIELPVVTPAPVIQQPISPVTPVVQAPPPVQKADNRELLDYMNSLRRPYPVAEVVHLSTAPEPSAQQQTPPAAQTAPTAGDAAPQSQIEIPLPGTILYAEMVSRANSDSPGPVLARILQGEYAGATLVGSFQTAREGLVIQFNQMTVTRTRDGREINETVPIRSFAVDTSHIGTSLATSVDRHLFEKLAFGFTASFAEGFGSALASSGRTRVINDNGTIYDSAGELSTEKQLLAAGGHAVSEAGNILMEEFGNRPTTIIVESGTPIGILFL